jgi:nucleoside-diphosphate-sugar epimerase
VANKCIGVIGATSLVGHFVLSLLTQKCYKTIAYTRQSCPDNTNTVEWQKFDSSTAPSLLSQSPIQQESVPLWVCVAPIWILPQHFDFLLTKGIKRIVLLSSTSRFTKANSNDIKEQAISQRLEKSEELIKQWAKENDIEWIILRPTLIYGLGRDKNIAEITHFIKKFGFFPLFGKALGLRQPVHAEDVADACISALESSSTLNRSYNISGGETLTYRKMISRIFSALEKRPYLIPIPLSLFSLAVKFLRLFPRYRHWSTSMAERMNQDLIFDHTEANEEFCYKARVFSPTRKDLGEP